MINEQVTVYYTFMGKQRDYPLTFSLINNRQSYEALL